MARLARREGGGWIRQAAGMAAGAIAGYARQYARGRAQQAGRNSVRNDQATAVTGQTDHKVRFAPRKKSRKQMQRYKKMRRFKSKVLNAIKSDENPQWFRYSSSGTLGSLTDRQGVQNIGNLLSWVGDNTQSGNDVGQIYQDMTPQMYQLTSGGLSTPIDDKTRSKFTVKSAHMEVDVSNVGTTQAILDVYEVMCRRDTVGFNSLLSMITVPTQYWQGSSIAAQMGNTYVGATPYMMDDITSCFKIIGKSTYNIAAGGNIQIQMKGRRFANFYGSVISQALPNSDTFGRRGMTKAYIGVCRGTPNATGAISPVSLTWNNRRVYNVSLATNVYPDTATRHGA